VNRTRNRGSITKPVTWSSAGYPLDDVNRTFYWYGQDVPVADTFVGDREVTIDVKTENYWIRKRRGEMIFNPYVHTHSQNKSEGYSDWSVTTIADIFFSPPPVKRTYWVYGAAMAYFYRLYVGPFTNTILVDPGRIQSLQDEIWTECISKRQNGTANYVESLAELDKCYEMIRKPLINLNTFVSDFRKSGRRRKGYEKVNAQSRDFIRFLSSEWLRFRYGVSPLYSDVRVGMKALKKEFNSVQAINVSARSNGAVTKTLVTNGSINTAPSVWGLNYIISKGHTINCRAVWVDRYKPSIFDDLGLTFHNVVGVPWELTKLSFVVDWFANVGSLIYANIPRVGIEPLGGVIVTREVNSSFYSPNGPINCAPSVYTMNGGPSDTFLMTNQSTVRDVRSAGQTSLVIKADFRLDHWVRATDAFTLAVQQLGSIGF